MRLVTILFLFVTISCNPFKKPSVTELIDIDKSFSDLAGKIGYGNAFIEFAHPDAVILRKNSMPVSGKSEISKLYDKADTSNVKFFWVPISGIISKSGDLGYTYGIYTFQKDTVIKKGTYVSIWKKSADKKWKYILDTGNEGLGQ